MLVKRLSVSTLKPASQLFILKLSSKEASAQMIPSIPVRPKPGMIKTSTPMSIIPMEKSNGVCHSVLPRKIWIRKKKR